MRISIVGPGRAGMAVAIAARNAGHEIAAVIARNAAAGTKAAARLGARALSPGESVPESDLLLIATRDDAISDAAAALVDSVSEVAGAAHLSGLASTAALNTLAAVGLTVGSFHPLQTLPDPESGAARLAGSHVAVTAESPLRDQLHELAESIGAHPFDIADEHKPVYHAAAAAAANFPLAALTMASDLFEEASVGFDAARPLVEAVVANAFEIGPRAALTGPVARGDLGTVTTQLDAVATLAPQWIDAFEAFVETIAGIAGRGETFAELLAGHRKTRQ